MSRSSFTESDIARAVKGVTRAGQIVREVRVGRDGQITVLTGSAANEGNDLDKWLMDNPDEGRLARIA